MNSRNFKVEVFIAALFAATLGVIFMAMGASEAFAPGPQSQAPEPLGETRPIRTSRASDSDWDVWEGVWKVSPGAAQLMTGPLQVFGREAPAPCRQLTSQVNPSLVATHQQQAFDEAVETMRDQCRFAYKMRAAVEPTFLQIAYSGRLPPALYAFELSLGAQASWQTVGLFAEKANCERLLSKALRLHYRATPCHPWKPEPAPKGKAVSW